MNPAPGIVDVHCHVASEMCFPRSFCDGIVDNMMLAMTARGVPVSRAKMAEAHAATLRDPWCDQLVTEMDEAGIAEAVLLIPDFTYALRDSTHSIAEIVEHHRLVRERHPGRFRVFAGVDPRWGADGLALFERAVTEYGFDGMKLYPPCGYTLSDPMLDPFYEICAEYGLPVLTHIGATSPVLDFDAARPIHLDRAARRFASVDFILAHGSVHYPDECAMLCAYRPNVYLDVSGFEVGGTAGLRTLFARRITHKVLFGTDWPIFRMQGRQATFVARLTDDDVFSGAVTPAERELFLAGTARRLLSKRTTPARPVEGMPA